MNAKLNIDRAGRVVLPKPVREQMQLEPGESLEMESFDDCIVLRPVRGSTGLHKKEGVWVFRGSEPIKASVVEDTIQSVREERNRNLLGKRR